MIGTIYRAFAASATGRKPGKMWQGDGEMTMAGRPKSNALKRLTGSRYYNENAPHPGTPSDLRVPRGLLPAEGRKFWRDNLPPLVELGLVTTVDLPAFVFLCQAWAFAQEAAAELKDDGLAIPDKKGAAKKHPSWQQWRDSVQLFLKIGSDFGMTPAMRSRLEVAPIVEANSTAYLEGLKELIRHKRAEENGHGQ